MKQLRIVHLTEYHYRSPVRFGPHLAMVRPREGHDVHIRSSLLNIEPEASVRWVRDVCGNSIAVITFASPSKSLRLLSEVTVEMYNADNPEWLIDPSARSYPFQYAADEQLDLIPYRISSYPHDGQAMQGWLGGLLEPGEQSGTFDLLKRLSTRIFEFFRYVRREEPGVQAPCRTLALGSGSCRDYAVFMMEAARHLGFAARFVTGYILMNEGQHGTTHAWTEIYIPGMGWLGFDPTNNKLAGFEHVSVGVAREHEKASPLSGSWEGPSDAFDRMVVSVQVVSHQSG